MFELNQIKNSSNTNKNVIYNTIIKIKQNRVQITNIQPNTQLKMFTMISIPPNLPSPPAMRSK